MLSMADYYSMYPVNNISAQTKKILFCELSQVCKGIDGCADGTAILERIFEGVSVYYNFSGEVECFELDDDPHGMDGWNWQVYSCLIVH